MENKITKLRNLIAARVPAIIEKLIDSANGDTQVAKLLIERTLPAYKAESMPVNIPMPEKLNLVDIDSGLEPRWLRIT